MAKQKVVDEDFDDFEEEEESFDEEKAMEEEDDTPPIAPYKKLPPNPPQRPVRAPIQVERTNKFAPQPKPVPENRFVAIHSPAIEGIVDKQTNKIFSTDIMEILADLKSQLNRIEESLG